jgi:hypothetical protein
MTQLLMPMLQYRRGRDQTAEGTGKHFISDCRGSAQKQRLIS